jgi:ATP-dependent DNA helicase RecQ
MMDQISPDIPVIALTATATPKVKSDIVKNLGLRDPNIFISSFNRPNLYYEIQPKIKKDQTIKSIVRYIVQQKGKSGIIYTLNRKTTEELADMLVANGIKAVAYHAGLDSKLRAERQDLFLNEDTQVIVATIAFGMGIDKPISGSSSILIFPSPSRTTTRRLGVPAATGWKATVSYIIPTRMSPSWSI